MFQSKKKKRQAILERQKKVKEGYFNFERIALYFQHETHPDAHQVVDDRTLIDMDFEELFTSMDRTSSSIGQQYMYSKLRVIPHDLKHSQIYDSYIDYLNTKPEQQEDAIIELNALNNQGAYFLQRLFFGDQVEKPTWFWIIPVLSISTLITLVTAFFYTPLFLLVLLLITINTIIHTWNKNNVLGYSNTVPQLLKLHKVASSLNQKEIFINSGNKVDLAIKALDEIKRSALFFKWESKSFDEATQVSEFILDLIKGAFLIEPIVFFRLLKQIALNKTDIKTLYETVGELDMAISLSTWYESLPYYCQPQYSDASTKIWSAEKLYHPLIENPTANGLTVADEKSILLSGSNMSGKTTFIRTIGINALLAQTINIACAKKLTLSHFRIYSAIHIADDLLDNTSYYYQEVKTIKQFTYASQSSHFNLFLLDEIFKGTNTIERIASGKAVLSYLNDSANLVFCSTHDLELIDYLQNEYEYYHFVETIEDETLIFDYKLKKGSLNNTNAIRILEMNDYPIEVTQEAKSIAEGIAKIKNQKK